MIGNFTRALLSKGTNRLFSSANKKPNLTKTGRKKEVFLDSAKFEATGTYLIYQARDLTKMRLIFLGALGFGAFHTYSYFYGEEQEFDAAANTLFAILSSVTVFWMGWRTRKTLKSLEILNDGKTLLLKKNSWYGFSEDVYQFKHTGMKGVGYWVNKRMKMPMLRVRDEYNNKMDVSFKFQPLN